MAKKENGKLGEIIANARLLLDFAVVIVLALIDAGGTDAHIRAFLGTSEEERRRSKELADKVARFIIAEMVRFQTTVSAPIMVTVDYIFPDFDVLKAWFTGYLHPSYKNIVFTTILACAKVQCKVGNKNFVLVHLGANASTDEVLAELDRLGLRPAFATELYAYSRANPTAGLEFPIVALGDTAPVDGFRRVACLSRGGGVRAFGLRWYDDGWGGFFRFLAVRKEVLV